MYLRPVPNRSRNWTHRPFLETGEGQRCPGPYSYFMNPSRVVTATDNQSWQSLIMGVAPDPAAHHIQGTPASRTSLDHTSAPPLAEALRQQYSIERELGRGGMAVVLLARDLRHDRLVAIKVLHHELAAVLG